MSAAVFERVRTSHPDATPVTLELRGKAEPVQAYVLDGAVAGSRAGAAPA
jgi:hypothetical protein